MSALEEGGARILIIDDEEELLDLSRTFLQNEGFFVLCAKSAQEGLEHLRSSRFDAIVCDYQMPMMTGIELLKAIRAQRSNIPFILFTGKGREEVVIEALNSGADFYLQKGGNPNAVFAELAHKIRGAVARRKAESNLRQSEERLRTALEAANQGMWEWNVETGEGIFSDSYYTMLGYAPGDFSSSFDSWKEMLHPDDKEATINGVLDQIAHSEYVRAKYRMRDKSGEWRWIEWRGRIIDRDEEGLPLKVMGTNTDITDLVRTEAALRESEADYRELFNRMMNGVAVYEPSENGEDFIIKDLNAAGQQLSKARIEDIKGRSVLEVFPAVSDIGLLDVFKRVWKTGIPEHLPNRHYDDGKLSEWVENDVFKMPSGEIVAVYADVTDRKKAEEALLENEGFLSSIFENIPDMILVKDAKQLRYVRLNRAAEEWIGQTREDVLGKRDHDLFPAEVAESFVATDQEALQRKSPVNIPDETVATREGAKRILHTKKIPILDEKGDPLYLLEISEDITEWKATEGQAQTNERRFQALFQSMEEGVALHTMIRDGEGKAINYTIDKVNPQFEKIFGLRKEDAEGGLATAVYGTAEAPFLQEYEEVIEGRSNIQLEVFFPPMKKHFHISVMALDNDRFGTIFFDFTDRRKAEVGLLEANLRLRILSKVTRHDIMNQLTVLHGYLELERTESKDRKRSERIENMLKVVSRINDQIRFAKAYQNVGMKAPEWQSVQKKCEEAAVQLDLSGVKISIYLAGLEIMADLLLSRVFSNLIDNSLKHGEKVRSIRIWYETTDEGAKIIYEDDGIGISEIERKHLFEEGFGKGHGMGMFLSRQILKITRIEMRETGIPGEGIRFEMMVPDQFYRIVR